jgi:hypothetical protein
MSALSEWAKHSTAHDFWLIAGIIALISIAGFAGAFYYFKRRRIVEDTPRSKIRSAAQGYVELGGHGDLMDGPAIVAPLTGKYCTWYSYNIEERRSSGKNAQWANIENGKCEELFLIVDDTGQCVIDPDGASITTAERDVWYGATPRPNRGPEATTGLISGGNYRYTETRLRPKEALFAMGLFKTIGGAEDAFSLDGDVRELLKEWKKDTDSLLEKFDANKDGEIDMEEWQAVREVALREVMAKQREGKVEMAVNMLVKTHDHNRPFLLSALAPSSLIRRYQIYSIALLLLFFIGGSFVSVIINLRLAGE